MTQSTTAKGGLQKKNIQQDADELWEVSADCDEKCPDDEDYDCYQSSFHSHELADHYLEEENDYTNQTCSGYLFSGRKTSALVDYPTTSTIQNNNDQSPAAPSKKFTLNLLQSCVSPSQQQSQSFLSLSSLNDKKQSSSSNSLQRNKRQLLTSPLSSCSLSIKDILVYSSNPRTTNNDASTDGTSQETPLHEYTQEELDMKDGHCPTIESDLRPTSTKGVRHFWVVTTAALPWMTGTAINPLLRAAYLSKMNRPHVKTTATSSSSSSSTVTLVIPWLESSEERCQLYGDDWKDATPQRQESYIRQWLSENANLPLEANLDTGGIQIVWYPAKYVPHFHSVFATSDICETIYQQCHSRYDQQEQSSLSCSTVSVNSRQKLDVCFLEEPERLDLYTNTNHQNEKHHRPKNKNNVVVGSEKEEEEGKQEEEPQDTTTTTTTTHTNLYSWKDRFVHVVGIVHTNYKAYSNSKFGGLFSSLIGKGMSLFVQASCHKVVKLSPVLQNYCTMDDIGRQTEIICNVHGVRSEFLAAAAAVARRGGDGGSGGTADASTCSSSSSSQPLQEEEEQGQQKEQQHSQEQQDDANDTNGDEKRNMVHEPIHSDTTTKTTASSGHCGGGIYFIGKVIWDKGFDKMLELEDIYDKMTGNYFPIDIYGSGPEELEIQRAFLGRKRRQIQQQQQQQQEKEEEQKEQEQDEGSTQEQENENEESSSSSTSSTASGNNNNNNKEDDESLSSSNTMGLFEKRLKNTLNSIPKKIAIVKKSSSKVDLKEVLPKAWVRTSYPIPASFKGRRDHAALSSLEEYKIFVNPSVSEVLCTTTAEALAMGKFVIIPEHPSNVFFTQFPNCLQYNTNVEFVEQLQYALSHNPKPLTENLAYQFTWEAAMERCIESSIVTRRDAHRLERIRNITNNRNNGSSGGGGSGMGRRDSLQRAKMYEFFLFVGRAVVGVGHGPSKTSTSTSSTNSPIDTRTTTSTVVGDPMILTTVL